MNFARIFPWCVALVCCAAPAVLSGCAARRYDVADLLVALESDDEALRDAAIDALAERGPSILAPLREGLQRERDAAAHMRLQTVIRWLEEVDAWNRILQAMYEPWKKMLTTGTGDESRSAIKWIAEHARRTPAFEGVGGVRFDLLASLLESALACREARVRRSATRLLGLGKRPEMLSALLIASQHGDPVVRYVSVEGLKALADIRACRPAVVRALRRAQIDEGSQFIDARVCAASALDRLGEKFDVEAFVDAMRLDPADHAMASMGLARLGRTDCVELILRRLERAGPDTDAWCGAALERLTGQTYKTDRLAWRTWFDANRAALPDQVR